MVSFMQILAFMCTGQNACRVETFTLWAVGLIWSGAVIGTTVALARGSGKVWRRTLTGIFAVVAATYVSWMALAVASLHPYF